MSAGVDAESCAEGFRLYRRANKDAPSQTISYTPRISLCYRGVGNSTRRSEVFLLSGHRRQQ